MVALKNKRILIVLTAVKSIGESIRENSNNDDPINRITESPKLNEKKRASL